MNEPEGAGGESAASDGTTGGLAGSGGAGAPAGLGGAAGAGTSMAEACIAFTTAECKRVAECSGSDAGDCFSATQYCPDAMFSPGSTRTVSGLLACAAAYATYSCEDLKRDQRPACATPGTLEAGSTCEFSAQCASLTCVGSPCGKCAQTVGAGEACATEGVVCAAGFFCRVGGCTAVPAAPPELGDSCTSGADCPDQAYCGITSGSTSGTCIQYPDAGAPCADFLTCLTGNFCDLDETCRTLPGEGAACGVDALTGRATYCAADLVCVPGATLDEGTCSALHGEREPCVTDAGAALPESCARGLYCDTSVTPATCTAPKGGGGEICLVDAGALACQEGYQCRCADDACATHWCEPIGFAGDPCDSANPCHPAFGCSGGVCVPLDSQGYAERCPG